MIATQEFVNSNTRDHAEREAEQDLGMKWYALRLIRRHFVKIGSYFTFKRISLDSIRVVSFFRHVCFLARGAGDSIKPGAQAPGSINDPSATYRARHRSS